MGYIWLSGDRYHSVVIVFSQITMLAMCVMYLIVALLIVPTVGVPVETSTVQEIDSLLVVQETVNVHKIELHLHLWARELSVSHEKLDRMMATRVMRESTLLLSTLSAMTGTKSTVMTAKAADSIRDNSHSRYKRNILGDFLHAVTGVATSDELQKQVKIDAEIRDKITATLTRQLAFEKTIAGVYGNLSREEESIQRRLDVLEARGETERAQLVRLSALSRLALDDVEELEDVLEAVRLGEVNTRHATRLSYRAGLQSVAHFRVDGVSSTEVGPSVQFAARIYGLVAVRREVVFENYVELETQKTTYLLHKSHSMSVPISEVEVRATSTTCSACGLLVSMGGAVYKSVRQGEVTCNGRSMNLTLGQVLLLGAAEDCENAAMRVGDRHLNVRRVAVDLEESSGVDSLFLKRAVETGRLTAESSAAAKEQHLLGNLKLQSELGAAQQDLSNFIEETKIDMSVDYVKDGVTWSLVGGLCLVLGVLMTCICCRYASRRPTTVVIPTSHSTASVV